MKISRRNKMTSSPVRQRLLRCLALVVAPLVGFGLWFNSESPVETAPLRYNDNLLRLVVNRIDTAASSPRRRRRRPVAQSTPPRTWDKNAPRGTSDTGVDLADPELYRAAVDEYDSSTATVMGMATGYDLDVYKRFVGSLRKTGFDGHIILGVAPNVSPQILKYFEYRNVTPKIMQYVNCSFIDYSKPQEETSGHERERQTCAYPYPNIKIRWSRFPLARDWLVECQTCTGPVLIMDVRDSLFQQNPFGPSSPEIRGLQVYEEHKVQTTEHWLTKWPLSSCKGVEYNQTMLCSGTTTGTRVAMLKYLEIMYGEMKTWMPNPKCHFNINGDDQSIHNHLYYSGQLPFATAMVNRGGGIVHTVGKEGAMIWNEHVKHLMATRNMTRGQAAATPYHGSDDKNQWIGPDKNLINTDGLLTDFDGQISRVVHQWDRLGVNYERWLRRQQFVKDDVPSLEEGVQ